MKKLIKEKNIQVETLTIITLVLLVLTIGFLIFNTLTNKKRVSNFKESVNLIDKAAKNAYVAFSKEGLNDYIVTSHDGTNAMCITLDGILSNGLIDMNLDNWNGYIVVEDMDNLKTTLYITNKEFSINGISSDNILKMNDKDITDYDDENFINDLGSKFNSSRGNSYDGKCIDKKIE